MRIIAGEHRGVSLAPLGKGDHGAHLRPTSDRVRESLFSVLTHLGVTDGARVLDLFAGTGALGLEALSRGAAHATFVDNGRTALGLLRQNIAKLRVADRSTIVARDARRLPVREGPPAGLIFLDPPYGKEMGEAALATAGQSGWLASGALIVWEEAAPMPAPPGFDLVDQRRYGDTQITFLSKADA
ncbi:16S rRNA (guanine(966)-N(2))-methyltransferase RsmD [uncultured Roseobacter sp.]|uniref:16S rRNA (guanine(966)-N(2))-methyltransferase RsmD n=1 Tax=uncultured Roseobacter sp. TaxID=114847 RepID=UPI00260A3BA5|nr:16S rRNA (guanine(966)-N(2))-methyltransferase RsmD [uncultured Roseobacter sp.]